MTSETELQWVQLTNNQEIWQNSTLQAAGASNQLPFQTAAHTVLLSGPQAQ